MSKSRGGGHEVLDQDQQNTRLDCDAREEEEEFVTSGSWRGKHNWPEERYGGRRKLVELTEVDLGSTGVDGK